MNTEEYQTRYGTDPDYIDANGEVYYVDELADLYEDMLDDSGTVTIGGHEYVPSEILKAVDPTAYRVGMSDYVSALGWDEWSEDHEWIEDDEDDEDEDEDACTMCGRVSYYEAVCDECSAVTPR